MAQPGCATTQPIVTKVDHVIDCLKPEIEAQIPAISAEVATDLLSANYADLLTKLEQTATSDVVICAVQDSVAKASARASTTSGAQPNAVKIQGNGNDYLKARGATFVQHPTSMEIQIRRSKLDPEIWVRTINVVALYPTI